MLNIKFLNVMSIIATILILLTIYLIILQSFKNECVTYKCEHLTSPIFDIFILFTAIILLVYGGYKGYKEAKKNHTDQ